MPTFSSGITVKLKYASGDASASSWAWQSYHANNPETRYASLASPTFTGTITGDVTGDLTGDVTGDLTGDGSDLTGLPKGSTITDERDGWLFF